MNAVDPHRQAIEDAIMAADGVHTVADLARRWGISKARADELSKHPDFPSPLLRVGRSSIYVGSEVDAWRALERKPGWPKGRPRPPRAKPDAPPREDPPVS